MTPADEGIAAAKADNASPAPMLAALAREHVQTIARRAQTLAADVKNYHDPALFDPSDLGEIGHALEQLRRICGEAAAEHGDEDLVERFPRRETRPQDLAKRTGLETIDTGGGCLALGFELSRPGLEVCVLINSHEGEMPDAVRSDNLAALFIDGSEVGCRRVGDLDEVTAWAKSIRQTLEEIDAAGHFRFISWARLARHFDGGAS